MYELLSALDIKEFRDTVLPIVKRDTKIPQVKEEKPFKVFVGKHNRIAQEESVILSGILTTHMKTLIIKFLIPKAEDRIKHEQGAYLTFCEMLLEHFFQMVKDKKLQSLLIHTNDNIIVEVLLKNKFEISKTKNNFYKAFKLIN